MSQIGSNPAECCRCLRRAWRWTVLHQCIGKGVVLFAPLLWAQTAHAHGIAGNRYFDGTMTFDDPSVADEAILPYWANSQFPTQGSNVAENRINCGFTRIGRSATPRGSTRLTSG